MSISLLLSLKCAPAQLFVLVLFFFFCRRKSLAIHWRQQLCPCHAPTIGTNQTLSTINKRLNTPFTQTQTQIHIHSLIHSHSRLFTTFTTAQTELSAKYQQLFRVSFSLRATPHRRRPPPPALPDWHCLFDFRLANSPQKKMGKRGAKLAAAACQLFAHTHTPRHTPCNTHTLSPTHTHTLSHTQAACLNDFSFATQQSRLQKIMAWRFSCECRVKWMRKLQ